MVSVVEFRVVFLRFLAPLPWSCCSSVVLTVGSRPTSRQAAAHNASDAFQTLLPQLLEISDFTLEPCVAVV